MSEFGHKAAQLDVQRESAMRSRADIELDHAGIVLRLLRLDQDTLSGVPMSLKRLPAGQITEPPVQPRSQKYSGSLQTQITSTSVAIPSSQEGRIAIVTDVGRGMRWTLIAR